MIAGRPAFLCIGWRFGALVAALLCLAPAARAQTIVFTVNTTISGSNTMYEGFDVTVRGCTVTINGAHSFHSLTVERNASNTAGVVTHGLTSMSGGVNGMSLTIAGDVHIEGVVGSLVGSRIDVNGHGFGSQSGPGAGGQAAGGAGGGGYGGRGGAGAAAMGGPAYGSLISPSDHGSGGGTGGAAGAFGGGAVRLQVSGTMTLDGTISADGNNGSPFLSGAGSGGSVWITAATFLGTGRISANGGNATGNHGGGAGGRIALDVPCNSAFDPLHLSVQGGTGFRPGQPGTVFWPLPSGHGTCTCAADWNNDLRVDSQDYFDFLTDFFIQRMADFNGNGRTDSQDFFDFINAFLDGCG